MDFARKSNHEELKKLLMDSEQFWAQTDPKTCTVTELIERFLIATDSSLPAVHRLIALADVSHLGWRGVCEVYEYILGCDPDPTSRHGSYISWIVLGMSIMKDITSLTLEDRVRVAVDVEAVIERSVKETGFPAETTRGYFYYEHPLREKHPQIYLINSKEWFERAIEAQDDVDFDFHDFQILAGC